MVLAAVRAFDVQLDRIHNDSTSVRACGRTPGCTRTGLELRHGHSKDHRPDLKQLVFSLSITADGAVPIHHRVYPGNTNDDTTHIETWNCLRKLHDRADFLYVADFIDVRIVTHLKVTRLRPRGRPPGEKARYRIKQKAWYSLEWKRNAAALTAERRVDGVFPLLSTDRELPPREVLKAWKYQPRLEKRFEQFKQVHRAAPLLFKKIERVEANMFIFFVALMVQALLERQVRKALKKQKKEPLKLYPEDRDAPHPTTSQILKTFAGLSSYAIEAQEGPIEEYRDELKEVHAAVLELMDMDEEQFWTGKTVQKIRP